MALVATALVALVIGTTVDVRCEANDASSLARRLPPFVSVVGDASPFAPVRLDCVEQAHDEPTPEPVPLDFGEVTTVAGTTVVGSTTSEPGPYIGGALPPA